MYCEQYNCIGQFTGFGCESCLYFNRTPENIKKLRKNKEYHAKEFETDIKTEIEYEKYYQEQTDKIWNEYCKEEQKNNTESLKKEADEYAEYLRLKSKYEGETD